MKVDNNLFYSNNLHIYGEDSPIVPLVPQAVGTGIMWPGMNDGEFSNNQVFDNWQYGTLLIGIPDAIAGEAEGNVDPQDHCDASAPRLLDLLREPVPRQRDGPGARRLQAASRTRHVRQRERPPRRRRRARRSSRTAPTSGGTRRRPRTTTAGSTTSAPTARATRSRPIRRSIPPAEHVRAGLPARGLRDGHGQPAGIRAEERPAPRVLRRVGGAARRPTGPARGSTSSRSPARAPRAPSRPSTAKHMRELAKTPEAKNVEEYFAGARR